MIKSEHSARSVPPPTHQPCTWAMTGLRLCHRLMKQRTFSDMPTKSRTGSQPRVRLAGVLELRAPVEVVAGAEGAPGAAQHQDVDGIVEVGVGDGTLELARHVEIDGIEALGPIEHDVQHAVVRLERAVKVWDLSSAGVGSFPHRPPSTAARRSSR